MTGELRENHLLLPLSDRRGKSFAAFRITDLTAERAAQLTEKQHDMTPEEYDALTARNPTTDRVRVCTRFRNYRVDWRALLSATSRAEVEDRNVYVDRRANSLLSDALHVEAK